MKRLKEKKDNGLENVPQYSPEEPIEKINDGVEKTESNPEKSNPQKSTQKKQITNDMESVTICDHYTETFYLDNEKLYTDQGNEVGWYEDWIDDDGSISPDHKDKDSNQVKDEYGIPLLKYHITDGTCTLLLEKNKKKVCSECKDEIPSKFQNASCDKPECKGCRVEEHVTFKPKTYTTWEYDDEYGEFNRNKQVIENEYS
jgi:hypothetical protein